MENSITEGGLGVPSCKCISVSKRNPIPKTISFLYTCFGSRVRNTCTRVSDLPLSCRGAISDTCVSPRRALNVHKVVGNANRSRGPVAPRPATETVPPHGRSWGMRTGRGGRSLRDRPPRRFCPAARDRLWLTSESRNPYRFPSGGILRKQCCSLLYFWQKRQFGGGGFMDAFSGSNVVSLANK